MMIQRKRKGGLQLSIILSHCTTELSARTHASSSSKFVLARNNHVIKSGSRSSSFFSKRSKRNTFKSRAMPTRSYVSQGDKVETSPSGAAKCQRCREKIQKGSKRVGKELYLAKWNTYSHTYYHVECFKKTFPGQEPNLPGRRSLEMALDREAKQEATSRKLLDERRPLWEELRQLRLAFARRLDVSAFIVFENTVLDELVLHMPTTKNDILNIKGIKEKRYQSFGEPILEVIRDYLRRTNPPSSNGAAPAVEDQDEEDQAEEGVQIEGSLSCDEIVARKFEHATANGYMISV